uniref:Uncharacterized protein n=1 Tax=Romanomermis culicivorax TaxID=13658 RepID=A0A915I5A4_ROMCU
MNLTFTKSTQKATATFNSIPLTTQFLKISFPGDTAAISTGQFYYGLRIGVFGCLISNSTAEFTCLTLDPKDVWGERHFLETANGTVSWLSDRKRRKLLQDDVGNHLECE